MDLKLKPLIYIFLIFGIVLGAFGVVLAAFNEQINYQGKLTDSSNLAVADGEHCLKFRLMDAATDGNELWAEEWDTATSKITTTSGLFSVMLGTHQYLSSVNFNQTSLYLEVQYDPGCDDTYEEVFSPRKRLGAVPAAFEAEQLGGVASGSFLRSDTSDTFTSGTLTIDAGTTLDVSAATLALANNQIAWLKVSKTSSAINDIGDVTISSPADNEVLAYNSGTSTWINQTAAEAGLSVTGHTHTLSEGATDVTSTAAELNLLDLSGLTSGNLLVATGASSATWQSTGVLLSSPTIQGTVSAGAGLTMPAFTSGNITMGDGGTIGQAAGPLLTFDNSDDYLEITGGNVGIGTTGPDRKLDVLDASNPQFRITQADGSVYIEFQVAATTGDLTLNLDPGDDITFAGTGSSPGANLWICKGSDCPDYSLDDDGSLFVEGYAYFAGDKIKYPSELGRPKRTIILTATGAITPDTNGAAQTKNDGTNFTYYTLDFDSATDESAYWEFVIPDSFDSSTNCNVYVHWTASDGTAGHGVSWKFATLGRTEDEVLDASVVDEVEIEDALIAVDDVMISAAGSLNDDWGTGEYAVVKVYRDVDDYSGTNLSADAKLLQVKIEYSVTQESD
jgi:hypothetical protein